MNGINSFFVIFNNSTNIDLDISVVKRPNIPSPVREYKETSVPGRNGKLYEDLKTYSDIIIPVEFNFFEYDTNKFNEIFKKIKRWINNIKDEKLKFSDDLSFFYIVNKTEITNSIREIKKLGKFTVNFTCKPLMFLEEGQQEIALPSSLFNDYELAQPTYKILGEGLLTLTINGISVTANVGQNLIIDTEKGLCYRIDGTLNNIALTGKYEDLYLKEGNNTFSWSSGFTITVVPNWRCL